MAHINKCIEVPPSSSITHLVFLFYRKDLLRKSGKKAVDDHAAVWVPDSEAGTCMHCKKVQFTLVNRRHHCRKCGVVCCNACSSKRFLLPAQSSKPLRVCMTCYDELSSQSADQSYNKDARSGQDSSGEEDSDEEEPNNSTHESNDPPSSFY